MSKTKEVKKQEQPSKKSSKLKITQELKKEFGEFFLKPEPSFLSRFFSSESNLKKPKTLDNAQEKEALLQAKSTPEEPSFFNYLNHKKLLSYLGNFFQPAPEKKFPQKSLPTDLSIKKQAEFIDKYHDLIFDEFEEIKNKFDESKIQKLFAELKDWDLAIKQIQVTQELNEELFKKSENSYPTHTIVGKNAIFSRKKPFSPTDEKNTNIFSEAMSGEELFKVTLLRQLFSNNKSKTNLVKIILALDKDENSKFSAQDLEIFIKSELNKSTKPNDREQDRNKNEQNLLEELKNNFPSNEDSSLVTLLIEKIENLKEQERKKEQEQMLKKMQLLKKREETFKLGASTRFSVDSPRVSNNGASNEEDILKPVGDFFSQNIKLITNASEEVKKFLNPFEKEPEKSEKPSANPTNPFQEIIKFWEELTGPKK